MFLSGTHLLPQEACRAETPPVYTVVGSSFAELNSNPDKQASPELVDQPQAANVLRAPARNAAQELHEQQNPGLQQPGRSTTQHWPAAGEQQQNDLKAMPHQDSAGSSYTAVAARTGTSSPSTQDCMAQKQDAAPHQMPGTAAQHAGSGSTAASNSPKSESVAPSSRSSLALPQTQVDATHNAGGETVRSGQQQKQHTSKEHATAKLRDMDPSHMPIAKFDPSLVAAVKCAADILQSDDGWSKEEAAATIAALTAKFQNSKSKSAAAAAAAAAASAGKAAVDAAEIAHCMRGQPGSSTLHNFGARTAGVSSLPRQDLLVGHQWPSLHSFLPSLGKPSLSSGTSGGLLGTASSKPADTADGVLGPIAGSGSAVGNLNGLPMATGIPAWCAGTDRLTLPAGQVDSDCLDGVAMAAAGGAAVQNRLHVASSVGSQGLRPPTQQPPSSRDATGSGMYGAACSSSSGALDVQQEDLAAAAPPGDGEAGNQAADAGGGRAEAAADAADPAGAMECDFARKPSVASSGVCSGTEPRQAAEASQAAAAATQQDQHVQQHQEPAAPPVPAAGRGFPDAATAATVAAAAASAAAVHAALQHEQQQLAFDWAAHATKSNQVQIGVSRHVASGLINTLNQSGESSAVTSSQPQMPTSLSGLLQPGQPQALPLMSALLRSGDLPPVVAESLRARMGGYLQQQQQGTAGAGSAGQAASIAAAAAVASSGAAGAIGNKEQQEARAGISMQQSLQEQQQQQATMQLVMQQRLQAAQQEQYQLQQYKQQQQLLMQMDAPAESESRSVESIPAATSHASADAPVPEPGGRRKRGRQPSAKAAAAAAAAEEERATKRQVKASKHDEIAAPAQVAPKGKRGRPSKATKAAAAAAARAAEEAAADNRLERMHSAAPDRLDGMFEDAVGASAAAANEAACSMQGQNALGPMGQVGAAAQDQQRQLNGMGNHGMGWAGDYFSQQHAMRLQQQQHMQLQQQRQQPPQPDAADAAAAQQQFQQQLHQLPPINTGAPGSTPSATGTDARQLLQQLQELPPAAAQHVAKIAQQLPPDLPSQMRQSLLRWAVNTVTQQMGPSEDAHPPLAPQHQQQQEQQQPQQAPTAAATAAAMWGAAAAAAATAAAAAVVSPPAAAPASTAMMTAPPVSAFGLPASLQPRNSSTAMVATSAAAAAVEDRDIMSGLLAAAHNHPNLRNLQPQERKAFLERLLQQRNERLFAQSQAQQQQSQGQQQQQLLDPVAAAAAAAPAYFANWPPRQQQQQIQQQTSVVGDHAAAACVRMSMQMPCPPDPAAFAAQVVSQASAMAAGFTGIGTLEQAGSLPLPNSMPAANAIAAASFGALGGRGSAPAVLHHAATMPEGLGEAAAPAAGGSGNFAAAAAAAAMQRPQLHGINLQHLEYQLQAHGMSKKQLLELMKEVGPVAALNSIGIQPNQAALRGQGGPAAPAGAATAAQPIDAAAAAAMPTNFGVSLQQQGGQQQQMLVDERLQQLSGMAGQSSAMFGLQQRQQQQTSWMLGGASGANTLSSSASLNMSGMLGPGNQTISNFGPAANGLGANMLQYNSMQHAISSGASGVGNAALADMFHQQTAAAQQHSSMMPSFPSSFDPAAAAAVTTSSVAVAARHMQLPGSAVQPGAAADAGTRAADSWMTAGGGVAVAGFAAGFGHTTDNYNINSAGLDPPVLEMPDHLAMTQHSAAAGRMGRLQQHQQQQGPAMSSDPPGPSLTMPNDAEDLLGMDLGDVDALLAGIDPSVMAAGLDGHFPMPGCNSSIQGMHDLWSKAG